MSEPFLGEIRMFGFNFAPSGWQMCNGQTLAISQFSALFALLGTQFGGNGTSTFQLPNLQSRVAVHQGTGINLSTYTIGEQTGAESVALLSNNMPIHNHLVNCDGSATGRAGSTFGVGTGGTPANNIPGLAVSPESAAYSNNSANAIMSPTMIQNAGGNLPHNNIQPLLVVNFCIAMEGIFPSRN